MFNSQKFDADRRALVARWPLMTEGGSALKTQTLRTSSRKAHAELTHELTQSSHRAHARAHAELTHEPTRSSLTAHAQLTHSSRTAHAQLTHSPRTVHAKPHITKNTRRQTTWNSRFTFEFAVWVGIRDFRLMAGGNREKQLEITKQRGIHGKAVEFR